MSDQAQHHYFVPQPSHWMIIGSFALLFMAGGAAMWFNGAGLGRYGVLVGFALLVFMMFRWFGDVVRESEGGKYGKREDVSFRWGMSWFIFSEVMFFAAFFGALFYTRVLAVPDLGSLASRELLWPDFSGQWPSAGPGFKDAVHADGGLGRSRAQHPAAALLGRDADHRPLRHARGQPHQVEAVAVPDDCAWGDLPWLPGCSSIPMPIPS